MLLRPLSIAFLALLQLACQSNSTPDTSTMDPATEIAANPRLLSDYSVPIETMTLRGVRLGDHRDAIRTPRIHWEGDDGWIITRDNCRYRIVGNKVVTLGVWDQKTLGQLGVTEEADIERVFGKAQKVSKVETLSTKMTIYRFAEDQRRASWDRILGRLSTVNIGAAIATETTE